MSFDFKDINKVYRNDEPFAEVNLASGTEETIEKEIVEEPAESPVEEETKMVDNVTTDELEPVKEKVPDRMAEIIGAARVNVRPIPKMEGEGSGPMTTVSKGEKVRIISEEEVNGFYNVRVNVSDGLLDGYIAKQFLKFL